MDDTRNEIEELFQEMIVSKITKALDEKLKEEPEWVEEIPKVKQIRNCVQDELKEVKNGLEKQMGEVKGGLEEQMEKSFSDLKGSINQTMELLAQETELSTDIKKQIDAGFQKNEQTVKKIETVEGEVWKISQRVEQISQENKKSTEIIKEQKGLTENVKEEIGKCKSALSEKIDSSLQEEREELTVIENNYQALDARLGELEKNMSYEREQLYKRINILTVCSALSVIGILAMFLLSFPVF